MKQNPPSWRLNWVCPSCRGDLAASDENWSCPSEKLHFPCIDGIWRFLPPHFSGRFETFRKEYRIVRNAEGRGSSKPDFYRCLPGSVGDRAWEWAIRGKSFRELLSLRIGNERLGSTNAVLRILDLGAGNCWLSNRLSERGHAVVAVDISTDDLDGLGARKHYRTPFLSVQADFDHLPFAPGQFDLAIWNASLHYSTHYETTIGEGLRVLRDRGQLVILDSPLYRTSSAGAAMVREREETFTRLYGFPSNALDSENFLTSQRLSSLGPALGLSWKAITPWYGWRWRLSPLKAWLLKRRPPARFMILSGRRTS